MSSLLLFIAIVIVLPLVIVILIYNKLVRLRNWTRNCYKQIDIQLLRRHDLIPNLIEIAKKYMQHEESIFNELAQARSNAESARKNNDQSEEGLSNLFNAEEILGKAMGNFNAVVENYPELKADSIMIDLQEEVSSTENRIAYARQAYNDGVMEYNNTLESFPAFLFAKSLGFLPQKFANFITNESQRATPKVSFDN